MFAHTFVVNVSNIYFAILLCILNFACIHACCFVVSNSCTHFKHVCLQGPACNFLSLEYGTKNFQLLRIHTDLSEQIPACGAGVGGGTAAGCAGLCVGTDGIHYDAE